MPEPTRSTPTIQTRRGAFRALLRRTGQLLLAAALVTGIGVVAGPAAAQAQPRSSISQAARVVTKAAFSATPAPNIIGTPAYGNALIAMTGEWMPGTVSFVFTWYSGGVVVNGQTSRTYIISAADVGKKITLTITGSQPGYTSVSKSSQATPTVTWKPANPGQRLLTAMPVPTITGSAVVGGILTAVAGTWAPQPVVLAYQWQRSGTAIAGANTSTYRPTSADVGHDISITVTGSRAAYVRVSLTSGSVRIGQGSSTDPTTGPGYDVVVILGQSNAQGAGTPFNPAIDVAEPGLDQLAGSGPYKGTVITAVDSLYQVTHWVSAAGPLVGPGMQFGRDLLATEQAGRKVLLVPAALGSTSITGNASYSWDPANTKAATNLYDRALGQIDQALALNPNNRLVAIIWAQGESDSTRMTGAVYEQKLLTIVDGLRARYGTVPFLIGAMVPEWVAQNPNRQAIDAAHRAVATERPLTTYVAGVTGHSQDQMIHYDAAGARLMGDRYFAALQQMLR